MKSVSFRRKSAKLSVTHSRSQKQADQGASGPAAALFQAPVGVGVIDAYGYSIAANGWFVIGWVSRPRAPVLPVTVTMQLTSATGMREYAASAASFERPDLDANHVGFIAYVPTGRSDITALMELAFKVESTVYRAAATHLTAHVRDPELRQQVVSLLAGQVDGNPNRKALQNLLSTQGYNGENTLSQLSDSVLLEIDEAILCPPDGLILKGWCLSNLDPRPALRVRSGTRVTELRWANVISTPRPDVLASVGTERGYTQTDCGFIAYFEHAITIGEPPFLEVTTKPGVSGFCDLPPLRKTGLDAIKAVLEGVQYVHRDLDHAFDTVLGPAVTAINAVRLRLPHASEEVAYGALPEKPAFSVIVPLYGRIDFLEYQMAAFARDRHAPTIDLIYVLDDPRLIQHTKVLATSVYQRFSRPFRILYSASNMGYAPANNLGLKAARAPLVCFLNSDVLPNTKQWLQKLAGTLSKNSRFGIVGPRLLFEDGAIQHEGLTYKREAEFSNWTFIGHENKGMRPQPSVKPKVVEALTGACMLMRRSLAMELGGFDERYVIGDFEDSDLCLRAKARGLKSAIDCSVTAYHLERQSQVMDDSNSRLNFTLYNAWNHERRFFTHLGRQRVAK
jgi:GT2 family glycosyltransferase